MRIQRWRRGRATVVFTFLLAFAFLPGVFSASAATGNPYTYTTDADFADGTLIAVNYDVANQLQLDSAGMAFDFIWVAASARGTIIKIDTDTGAILGEYLSSPAGFGANPSRTTVDANGNVWAGNRNETGMIADVRHGSVVSIGLQENGQCVDRNDNGVIDTSTGLGDIRAWPNVTDGVGSTDGATHVAQVQDAEDECIIVFQRTPDAEAVRHVSVDSNNDVWVGGYPFAQRSFHKLDGTGAILASFDARDFGCGGYGGLIDGNGILWSASISQSKLLRYDPGTNTGSCIAVNSSYGLGLDTNGFVWNSMFGNNTIVKVSPTGVIETGFPKATGGASGDRGVTVTPADNNVWVANSSGNDVSRLDNAGNFVTTVTVGSVPTGVAVDAQGDVWVTNLGSDNAMRIDPTSNLVNLTVDLGAGAGPYNYSDMTGALLIAPPSLGTWSVIHDSGMADAPWSEVSWTADEPSDSALSVTVASSANGVTFGPAVAVTNGGDPAVADGQYLKVDVSFTRATTGESPVLFDLTLVANRAPTADPNGPYVLNINDAIFDGTGSSDPDGDPLEFDWDFGGPGTPDLATPATPTFHYDEAGIYDVCLTVFDGFVYSDTVCTTAVIYDPDGGFVTGGGWIDSPAGALYPAGLPFFDGSYYELVDADPGILWDDANDAANAMSLGSCADPHLVTITSQAEQDALIDFFDGALEGKWYGGFQPPGVFPADEGWEWVTGETWDYTNWAAGEPNDAGGSERHLLGWLGGWDWNDEGATPSNANGYVVEYDDCELGPTGKATFGFVSKYKKGAQTPTGNTEFQFHAGDLNFHSSSYEWLVVNMGGTRAQYKGEGTINGEGLYKFMLWATDNDPDKFRIKIWHENTGDVVVYDNGFAGSGFENGQPISGGSIIVHTKKK